MAALAEAGVEVVGENRAQDLEAKHAEYGDAFRWHFIGHLQSRKAKIVNWTCELVHSLDSESSARRLAVPALVEVNPSGEETKSGVSPESLAAFPQLYGDVRGLMTMPPAADDPEASRPYFRRSARARCRAPAGELSMGTSQDRVAAEEGATLVRVGSSLLRVTFVAPMGLGDVWNRTLVYFGIAEDDDEWDEDGYTTNEELERGYRERPNVRRLSARQRSTDFDDWTDPGDDVTAAVRQPGVGAPPAASSPARWCRPCRRCASTSSSRAAFNDAQQVADKLKDGIPVILNLQGSTPTCRRGSSTSRAG